MAEGVSVVIAAYNRRDFVVRAVRSALRQDGVDVEVIVVDDGSTDGTGETAAQAGAMVVRQSNHERGAARNAGAARARKDLLCFLDSDDELLPNHLAPLADLFRRDPRVGLAYRDAALVSADGTTFARLPVHPVTGENGAVALMRANEIPFSGTTVRRSVFEAVGGFDDCRALSGAEDWELWTRIARRSSLGYVPGETVRIHIHSSNTVGDPARMEGAIRQAWSRITAASLSDPSPGRAVTEAWLTDTLVRTYLAAQDHAGAIQTLRNRLSEYPGQLLWPVAWKAAARILLQRASG